MSVLKKIGTILLKVGGVATELMGFPFIAQLLGAAGRPGQVAATVLGDFGSVAQVLSLMEAAYPSIDGSKTGSAKLAAASPVVAQIVQTWAQSNLPGHNKLKVSPEVFATHVQGFTSSFADIMNDFGD